MDRRSLIKQMVAGAFSASSPLSTKRVAQSFSTVLAEAKLVGNTGFAKNLDSTPARVVFPFIRAKVPTEALAQILKGFRCRLLTPARVRLGATDPEYPRFFEETSFSLVATSSSIAVMVNGRQRTCYQLNDPEDCQWLVRALCALKLDGYINASDIAWNSLVNSHGVTCVVLKPPSFEVPANIRGALASANTLFVILAQRLNHDFRDDSIVTRRTKLITRNLDRYSNRPTNLWLFRSDWVNNDLEIGDCRAVVLANNDSAPSGNITRYYGWA